MATRLSTLNIALRRGVSPTQGAPSRANTLAHEGAIGALPDDPPQFGATPAAAAAAGGALARPAQPAAPPFEGPSLRRQSKVDASPFASLAADESARRNMHALRVLCRLAAAIVRRPGSNAPEAVRSAQLRALVRDVYAAADRLTSSIAPLDAHRGWLRSSAVEAAANLVASQWESDTLGELPPLDVQIEAVEAVYREAAKDASLGEALRALGEASYVEATSPEVTASRIELSARLAAWDLHGHVTSPLLGQGAYRYTYSRKPAEIVRLLLPHALAAARQSAMHTSNLDVRTSHMQACIRRAADLFGAEYVARTRALMNWISQASITDEQYRARYAHGCAALESRVLPALIESARRNFFAVEAMSTRSIEGFNADQPSTQVQRNA